MAQTVSNGKRRILGSAKVEVATYGSATFYDLGLGEGRALEQLGLPLAGRHGVRDEDQGGGAGHGHRCRADDGLPRAAGEHHHAGAAVQEVLRRLALVAAQAPAVLGERHRVRLAIDVPREVLSRPAELEQNLLERPALGRVHDHGVGVDARPDERLDLLAAQHLLEHGRIDGLQHEAVDRVVVDLQSSVARHRLGHVDEQGMRHRVARIAQQLSLIHI